MILRLGEKVRVRVDSVCRVKVVCRAIVNLSVAPGRTVRGVITSDPYGKEKAAAIISEEN